MGEDPQTLRRPLGGLDSELSGTGRPTARVYVEPDLSWWDLSYIAKRSMISAFGVDVGITHGAGTGPRFDESRVLISGPGVVTIDIDESDPVEVEVARAPHLTEEQKRQFLCVYRFVKAQAEQRRRDAE